jgi:hypothetical protein
MLAGARRWALFVDSGTVVGSSCLVEEGRLDIYAHQAAHLLPSSAVSPVHSDFQSPYDELNTTTDDDEPITQRSVRFDRSANLVIASSLIADEACSDEEQKEGTRSGLGRVRPVFLWHGHVLRGSFI